MRTPAIHVLPIFHALLSFRGFFGFELSRRVFAFPPPPFFILLPTRGKKRCGKKLVAPNFEKKKTNRYRYRRYSGHIYKVYRVDRIVRMMHSREDGMEILSRREWYANGGGVVEEVPPFVSVVRRLDWRG